MNLDSLLRVMISKGASDLHLKVGCFPHLRIHGELVPLADQGRLDKEDSLMMAFSIMNNKQKERFRDAVLDTRAADLRLQHAAEDPAAPRP